MRRCFVKLGFYGLEYVDDFVVDRVLVVCFSFWKKEKKLVGNVFFLLEMINYVLSRIES